MKRQLLFGTMLAALALSSCSQSDDFAMEEQNSDYVVGTRAEMTVATEAQLRLALRMQANPIYVSGDLTLNDSLKLTYGITLIGANGGKITSTAPIVCQDSVTFKDLVIDATTPKGSGAINISAENIEVVLDNVTITQNTAGTSDLTENEGIGIQYEAYNNSLKILNGTTITLPNNYVRGINMYPDSAQKADGRVIVALEMRDSRITCGNNLSLPATYGRALSFSNVKTEEGDSIVIANSTIEGAYYDININGVCDLDFDIDNSSFDGRAAFNIWSPNTTADIRDSKLTGRNNYTGGSESFANIVINQGASNSYFYLHDVTFEMERNVVGQTNNQYAISFRESNQKVVLGGTLKIIEPRKDMTKFFLKNFGVTNVTTITEPDFNFDKSECNSNAVFEVVYGF